MQRILMNCLFCRKEEDTEGLNELPILFVEEEDTERLNELPVLFIEERRLDAEGLKSRVPLLRKYLDDDKERGTQALFGVQHLLCELEHPQGSLHFCAVWFVCTVLSIEM